MKERLEFSGKVILVTGAGSGIGRAIARAFAQLGGHVVVTDVNKAAAEETVDFITRDSGPGSAEAHLLDVASEAEVTDVVGSVVSRYKRVDVLVNNAGIPGTHVEPHMATEADFDRLFSVNVKGVWLCTKHVLPGMLAARKGVIVNIGSISGYIGNADLPLYHSTKGAVRLMSKTDAVVYASRGIRVNCINPGAIVTPLHLETEASYLQGPEAYRRDVISAHPIGKRGTPDDIAHAAVYLASDCAGFVTGADLFVDGGFTAQ
ncbi:Glucose 1-dehydrogenase 2 [compost metagenome]